MAAMSVYDHRLCVAPMMDWTDRHCRYFHRLLAPTAFLYTEMVTADAVLNGDRRRLLGFDPAEQPLALQLGGSDPRTLAASAAIAAAYGYDEINLNVGCPSDRVQRGRFGACLMKTPALVEQCVSAMQAVVAQPVTVKTRIGVDQYDSEAFLLDFVGRLIESGLQTLIVHARKAWLEGLSPKQNREVPPLDYERVAAVAHAFPDLEIILNGGIGDVELALAMMQRFDGVMLGRAAYRDPWILAELSSRLGQPAPPSRGAVVAAMVGYARDHLAGGGRLQQIVRHMLGLFRGQPGARRWRQVLSQNMHRVDAGPELLYAACPEPSGGAGPRKPGEGSRARAESFSGSLAE